MKSVTEWRAEADWQRERDGRYFVAFHQEGGDNRPAMVYECAICGEGSDAVGGEWESTLDNHDRMCRRAPQTEYQKDNVAHMQKYGRPLPESHH